MTISNGEFTLPGLLRDIVHDKLPVCMATSSLPASPSKSLIGEGELAQRRGGCGPPTVV